MKELIEKLQLAVSNNSNDISVSFNEAKVIIDFYEQYSKIKTDIAINKPEWLTDEMVNTVRELWYEPNIDNSNPRVKVIKLIQKSAEDAGYTVDIKKADEIIKNYCL